MKKVTAILMAALLCLGVAFALADDTKTFKPEMTNAAGFSSSKWFSSSDRRALLTIMMALDYAKVDSDFEASVIFEDSSYVAYDESDNSLYLVYFDSGRYKMLLYAPSYETVIYDGEWAEGSESILELALEKNDIQFYKNSISKLAEILKLLGEALDEL